jgi:hypothetical protein
MLTDESRAARNAYLRVHEPDYYAFPASLPATVREMHRDTIPTPARVDPRRARVGSGVPPASGVDVDTLAALKANLLER